MIKVLPKPALWDSHNRSTSGKAQNNAIHAPLAQICFFNADTGYAFTTVFAGLALTLTSLPKMFLTPAFVAGFVRVLSRQRPGIVKTPFFFTSVVAMVTRLLIILAHAPCFNSCFVASIFETAPLLMALAPVFMDLDFMGGNIVSQSNNQKLPKTASGIEEM